MCDPQGNKLEEKRSLKSVPDVKYKIYLNIKKKFE